MFSLLPLAESALVALREQHHIYALNDGRMNVAGISAENVGRVAAALAHCSPEHCTGTQRHRRAGWQAAPPMR